MRLSEYKAHLRSATTPDAVMDLALPNGSKNGLIAHRLRAFRLSEMAGHKRIRIAKEPAAFLKAAMVGTLDVLHYRSRRLAVCIEVAGGFGVSTDGFRAHIAPVESVPDGIYFIDGCQITLAVDYSERTGKIADMGELLDWRSVTPDRSKMASVYFDLEWVDKGATYVYVALDGTGIFPESPSAPSICVDAKFLADGTHGNHGTLYYPDNALGKPIEIVSGDYRSVIMPVVVR